MTCLLKRAKRSFRSISRKNLSYTFYIDMVMVCLRQIFLHKCHISRNFSNFCLGVTTFQVARSLGNLGKSGFWSAASYSSFSSSSLAVFGTAAKTSPKGKILATNVTFRKKSFFHIISFLCSKSVTLMAIEDKTSTL